MKAENPGVARVTLPEGRLLSVLRWFEGGHFWPLLICLIALQLFKAPLGSSLWLDETLTLWVSTGSLSEVWSRAITYQGMSPLYFLILHAWTAIAGTSEYALRLPSLLAFAGFLASLFVLARRYFGRPLALMAVIVVLSHDATLKSALQARPYACALCTLTLSVLLLQMWLDQRRRAHLFGAVLCFGLTFYFQYLYLLAFVLHGALIAHAARAGALQRGDIALLRVTWGLLAVALIPGGMHLSALAARSNEIQFAPVSTFGTLLQAILPFYWRLFLAVALAVTFINTRIGVEPATVERSRVLRFALAWWILPPLVFFLLSQNPGGAVFVDRYYVWCVPGFALVVCALLARLASPSRGMMMAALLLMVVMREGGRRWMTEDWRAASRYVAKMQPAKVLLYSGLIESEALTAVQAQEPYLEAPFLAYPPNIPYQVVPSDFRTEEARAWFIRQVQDAPRPLVLVASRNRRPGRDGAWIATSERFKEILATQGLECKRVWPTREKKPVEICVIEPPSR